MSDLYKLMHKNILCGAVEIDNENSALVNFERMNDVSAPFLGNADLRLMKQWWEARSVPASRKTMQEVLRSAGCETPKEYLAKNLALSLSDSYWICPEELDLSWEDVNLYRNTFGIFDGKIPYHNASSYDPNASLGGQMDKYWDMSHDEPVLVKIAYKEYGQQALNEVFATEIHRSQDTVFPYVHYHAKKAKDNGIKCYCKAFTSENTELVSAFEVINSRKIKNDVSLYDAFVEICAEHGIDQSYMREYMDYQTLTDFIISNTDEHLMNFGILRDSNTLRFSGPAPIFDSGNSMFYNDNRVKPYERYELLKREITSFHNYEEAMLKHIKNKNIVNSDLLPDPSAVKDFYEKYGVPSDKAKFISINYGRKIELLKEFQKGKTISFFSEKKRFVNMQKPYDR